MSLCGGVNWGSLCGGVKWGSVLDLRVCAVVWSGVVFSTCAFVRSHKIPLQHFPRWRNSQACDLSSCDSTENRLISCPSQIALGGLRHLRRWNTCLSNYLALVLNLGSANAVFLLLWFGFRRRAIAFCSACIIASLQKFTTVTTCDDLWQPIFSRLSQAVTVTSKGSQANVTTCDNLLLCLSFF